MCMGIGSQPQGARRQISAPVPGQKGTAPAGPGAWSNAAAALGANMQAKNGTAPRPQGSPVQGGWGGQPMQNGWGYAAGPQGAYMGPKGSPMQGGMQYGMRPQGQPMQSPNKYGHAGGFTQPQSPLRFPSGQPLQRNQYDFAQAVFGGNDRLQNRPYLNFHQMMGR